MVGDERASGWLGLPAVMEGISPSQPNSLAGLKFIKNPIELI